MNAQIFSPSHVQMQSSMAKPYPYALSPPDQSSSFDGRMSGNAGGKTILMRKLPRTTSREALRTMLLFAKDLKDADFVPNEFEEDQGFLTAVARFETATAASEAQAMLDGKPNTAGQANMIVEVMGSSVNPLGRRNTIDHSATRGMAQSVSPPTTNTQLTRQSSRFNGTFQSMEKLSPPNMGSPPAPEISSPDNSSHLQSLFSPQSPVTNNLHERSRVTGKSVIDQDVVDDDTREILKDPVAYLQNDRSTSLPGLSRRPTNPQIPLSRFASLSLNTNMTSPSMANYASPRSAINNHTPSSAISPTMGSLGPNAGYQLANQHYHRHNYPPVNPADQNPPCNTLYVGNLPIDTSEDELKAMFSKQRGYKRLCFRTKQNGPMCFVEFEDVSFATKALNELYGVQLHNSVKGGIRLSFSKNPLGVRAGQPGGVNPSTPLSPQGPMSNVNGLGPMSPGGFSAVNGPPPGLSVPPGLGMPMPMPNGASSVGISNPMTQSLQNGGFASNGLGIGGHGMNFVRGIPVNGGMSGTSAAPAVGGVYPDYMMGR